MQEYEPEDKRKDFSVFIVNLAEQNPQTTTFLGTFVAFYIFVVSS